MGPINFRPAIYAALFAGVAIGVAAALLLMLVL
jgi:hypothetical protein